MSFRFAGSYFGQTPSLDTSATVSPFESPKPPTGGKKPAGRDLTYGGKASVAQTTQRKQSVTKAMEDRANAAYALLIQQVIAAQGLRDYVSDAKKAFESTDKTYAPVQYEARKKKYIEEYGKQLLRLANSIGRVTVEEKTYPGSFFDEQVVVRTLPTESAELFRNPMVRAAAYDDFMSAIAKAQGAMGVDLKIITDTKKFADAKYREAVDSGKGKWGAENLTRVPGAPASWEPVVIAAAKGEAFPRIEYLTSADQVREISPWLADTFRRRSSSKALKTLVGSYVADRLGVLPGATVATTGEIFAPGRTATGPSFAEGGAVSPIPAAAVDRTAFEKARKDRQEAARQKENARKEAREAVRKAQEAEAARKKAAAEGKAADEARLAAEKAAAEAAVRDAEAKAREADRAAREAEQKLREATGPSTSSGASGGGEVAPFTPPSGGGGGVAPAPGESAPTVVADDQGGTAIVVPDASVAVTTAPAAKAVSPVVLLLAAAAVGGGIWWFSRRRGA